MSVREPSGTPRRQTEVFQCPDCGRPAAARYTTREHGETTRHRACLGCGLVFTTIVCEIFGWRKPPKARRFSQNCDSALDESATVNRVRTTGERDGPHHEAPATGGGKAARGVRQPGIRRGLALSVTGNTPHPPRVP